VQRVYSLSELDNFLDRGHYFFILKNFIIFYPLKMKVMFFLWVQVKDYTILLLGL